MCRSCLILVSVLGSFGLLACSGKRLNIGHEGDDGGRAGSGAGQAGGAAGAAGSAAGAAGAIMPTGTGGAAGQAGGGGSAVAGDGLSVNPSSATFASTLVEAVSAPQTFTVRNEASTTAATTMAAAFAGANAADFLITSNGCGPTLQPGASCEIAVAFAPKTRSGSRTARLTLGDAAIAAPANVSLSGTALPSLGLLAGAGGPGAADGTGAAARFRGPLGAASDGAGNVFVADTGNATIRKVVVATGAVTTLAGAAGQLGTADGTGAAARFTSPTGVASDGAGNLYVADSHTIRRIVVATGVVTTIAPRFDGPGAIASDGAGNLFVTDNYTIRKVVIATGAVTTLAGAAGQRGNTDGTGATARFDGASGIVGDGAGNLYIADIDNFTIRKIVIATGAVTTFAGAGQPGSADGTGAAARFFYPSSITSDGAGNLYVTDSANQTIRRVVIATGAVTTLAGTAGQAGVANGTGAAARFNFPSGIASDGAGNLFVADNNNNNVRKVVIATGAVTTFAGAAGAGSADGTGAAAVFRFPSGIASDGLGNLYVTDTRNYTIRKLVVATKAVTTLAGEVDQSGRVDGTGAAARFEYPSGIATDGAGNLFVADLSSSNIRNIAIATGAVTTLGQIAGVPSGMASDGAGNLFVADDYWNTIHKVTLATRAVTMFAGGGASASGSADGTGTAARFLGPSGVTSDGAGNLYVVDAGNGTIRKIVIATGAVTTLAGTAGQLGSADGTGAAARFNKPRGIASDGAGNLYVADANTIRKLAIETATVSTVIGSPDRVGVSLGALPASLNDSFGIAVLPTGELAIVDYSENVVLIGHL
jgi:sugar lactone lactonase YvrE